MFADDFPELSEPHQSEFFSGDRHIVRKALETDIKRAAAQVEPSHLLSLNTMIGIKSDDVLDEAKSLLHGWIRDDNLLAPPSFHDTAFQDEYNYADRWIEKSKRKPKASEKDLSAVRQMILESMPDTIKDRVSQQNLAVALKVRHEMAKERRAIIEEQKSLRKLQMEVRQAKIKEHVARQGPQKSARTNERISISRKKTATDIANAELDDLKKDQECVTKEVVLQIKKTELEQVQLKKQETSQAEMVEAQTHQRKEAYAKAEMMKLTKDTQCKRRALSAWIDFMQDIKRKSLIVEMKTNWRLINQGWTRWKQDTKKRNEKRELELIALEMRQEQQKMIKAIRHDRFRRLSSAILAWKQWIALEQQEKMIKIAHERRALKMQQFLMQLQNKHIQSIEGPPKYPTKQEKSANHRDVAGVGIQDDISQVVEESEKHNDEAEATIPSQKVPSSSTLQKRLISPKVSQVKILKATKHDQQLLQAMQNREKLRLERKAELARQREERQKEMQKLEAERQQEKERLEKEERDQIVAERKRLEKETRELMKLRRQVTLAVQERMEKAKSHHTKNILKFFGLRPLQRFLHMQHHLQDQADTVYKKNLKKRMFGNMQLKVKEKELVLEQKADRFYRGKCLQWRFSIMLQRAKKVQDEVNIATFMDASARFRSAFSQWKSWYQTKEQIRWLEEREKNVIADQFAKRAIPRRFLTYWKAFVKLQKEERWREYRKTRLRQAAQEVLSNSKQKPDLPPIEFDFSL